MLARQWSSGGAAATFQFFHRSGIMQRVLVTGATGFIGYEVARQLSALGLHPRLMVRRPERGGLLSRLDAELMHGDLTRPASLVRAVQGIDTIVHLGARAAFESYARLYPTIVQGSTALMQAAQQAGVRHFVYASSLFVYGPQTQPITAQTLAVPRLDYGRAKLHAEAALTAQVCHTDMRFAAIRLPHVYGARGLLFQQVHRGFVLFPGRGDNLFSHLHIEDAARVLIGVAAQGWSGISAVADDRSLPWRVFFATLWEHYPRYRELHLPMWLARLSTMALRPLLWGRSRPSLATPDTIVGWNLPLPVTPRLLWDELGLKPRYATIDVGIPAVLDECVAFRWQHPLLDRARY
jgi:nucleoside-diphosphate-sugar epimerase